MKSVIEYRPIRPAELLPAHQLELRCYPAEAAATLDGFLYRQQTYPSFFRSAWLHDRLIGIANGVRTHANDCSHDALKGTHDGSEQGQQFCVLTVAVAPEYRGQGIARKLMLELIQEASDHRLSAMLLMCERPLIRFYESLGFMYMGRSASSHADMEWHEMRKELTPLTK